MTSARRLTVWYLVALGAVAALSVGGSLVVRRLVSTQWGATTIIDVAGRQRMLTQRIGLTLRESQLADGPLQLALRDEANGLVNRLEAEQRWLEASLPEAPQLVHTSGVQTVLPPFLTVARKAAAGDAQAMNEASEAARGPMLEAFERQVAGFSVAARAQVDAALFAERSLLGLVLLLLAAEALFVFRPLSRSLRQTFTKLEATLAREVEQKQRLLLLVAAAGDGSVLLNEAGECLEVSARLADWFPQVKTVGFFEALMNATEAAAARARLASRQPVVAYVERGDEAFELRSHVESDEPYRVLVVVRDVTAVRALFATARQRDAAEARAHLTTAERLASLGTLAAGIAHEINNPASWIRANTEFVLNCLRNEVPAVERAELIETLEQTREGADRICLIVDDMRRMARGVDDEASAIDPKLALERVLRLASSEFKSRARLQVNLADTPKVLGTDVELGQVFLNLVINAVQAMPATRSREDCEVRVRSLTDERGWAVIEVEDNAGGVSPDVAKHLFTPFFTTKPPGVGTGLGLAICHGIVTRRGGEVDFRSEVGRGTLFRVALPPLREAPGGAPSDGASGSVRGTPKGSRRRWREAGGQAFEYGKLRP